MWLVQPVKGYCYLDNVCELTEVYFHLMSLPSHNIDPKYETFTFCIDITFHPLWNLSVMLLSHSSMLEIRGLYVLMWDYTL